MAAEGISADIPREDIPPGILLAAGMAARNRIGDELGPRAEETALELTFDNSSGILTRILAASGVRMQPTAQAVGEKWEGSKPRRGERAVLTHTLKLGLILGLYAALESGNLRCSSSQAAFVSQPVEILSVAK
jgi:hypothetical protein